VLDLVIGNRYARQMRDAADGIGVYGHAKAQPSIETLAVNRTARPSLYQRWRNEPTAGTDIRAASSADLDRIALAAHTI
jgi:hypothetical protein